MKQTLPKELEYLFQEFQDIFNSDNRRFTNKQKGQLERLGFNVYGEKHPKIRIGNVIITLQSTASDCNVNRVVLRKIRKVLISEFEKGTLRI